MSSGGRGLEYAIIRFQISEDELRAKKITSDEIYILICASPGDVLAKKKDT